MVHFQLTSQTWARHSLGVEWVYFLIMVAEPILSRVSRPSIWRIWSLMSVLFLWTALQRKTVPPAIWSGGTTSAVQSIWVILPFAMRHNWGLQFFQSRLYSLMRDLRCQLPEWYFYSMTVCIAWHKVLEGVSPPGTEMKSVKTIHLVFNWWRALKQTVLTTVLRFLLVEK